MRRLRTRPLLWPDGPAASACPTVRRSSAAVADAGREVPAYSAASALWRIGPAADKLSAGGSSGTSSTDTSRSVRTGS